MLRDKIEFEAGNLFDYKTQLTQDILVNASMYQKVETLREILVHLLMSHRSSLQKI